MFLIILVIVECLGCCWRRSWNRLLLVLVCLGWWCCVWLGLYGLGCGLSGLFLGWCGLDCVGGWRFCVCVLGLVFWYCLLYWLLAVVVVVGGFCSIWLCYSWILVSCVFGFGLGLLFLVGFFWNWWSLFVVCFRLGCVVMVGWNRCCCDVLMWLFVLWLKLVDCGWCCWFGVGRYWMSCCCCLVLVWYGYCWLLVVYLFFGFLVWLGGGFWFYGWYCFFGVVVDVVCLIGIVVWWNWVGLRLLFDFFCCIVLVRCVVF